MLKSKGERSLNLFKYIEGKDMEFDEEYLQNLVHKILILTIIILVMSVITMTAWNMSISKIFEIRSIDFYEACWLNILSHIILRPIEISFDK